MLAARKNKAFVAVPFIGKGAAQLLPIGADSVLVTRFSKTAVQARQVDPSEILKFLDRGVKVHAYENLHAKVYVFGRTCLIGSANASNSSRNLVEACLQCTEPTVVKGAREMVEKLTGNPLTREYVRSLIPFYPGEPPVGPCTGTGPPETVRSGEEGARLRVWVTPVRREDWVQEAVDADKVASKEAKTMIDTSEHRLFKAHWDSKPPFAVGDWIITRYGGKRPEFEVEPPARVISIRHVSRKGGYLVYGERPKDMRPRRSVGVERLLGSTADEVFYRGSDDKLIRKQQSARNVLQMWTAFRA